MFVGSFFNPQYAETREISPLRAAVRRPTPSQRGRRDGEGGTHLIQHRSPDHCHEKTEEIVFVSSIALSRTRSWCSSHEMVFQKRFLGESQISDPDIDFSARNQKQPSSLLPSVLTARSTILSVAVIRPGRRQFDMAQPEPRYSASSASASRRGRQSLSMAMRASC